MSNTKVFSIIAVLLIVIVTIFGAFVFRDRSPITQSIPEVVVDDSIDEELVVDVELDVAPFYFTVMTHMEGNFTDDKNEGMFDRHVKQIRYAMNLFDEYDAFVTIESERPFARANEIWGLNIMQEIVDRGHGVGTHCDFGGFSAAESAEDFAEHYAENKALVDALVGAENNRGCSGGNGASEWVLGAYLGGFEYLNGVVGFGYLAMDLSERPSGWTDQYIKSTGYHTPIPLDTLERSYFFRLDDATDLEPDEDGVLVISGGSLGELSSLEEGRENCFPNCVLELSDVDVIRDAIELVRDERVDGMATKLNIHIPVKLYDEKNEEILRALLSMVAEYVDDGTLVWATQLGAFEGYLEYESK